MDQYGNKNPEILITGAGPTGLMMACQLSLFNVPFRIVDMKKYPASQSGAMIIHSRSLEFFQQIGLAEDMLLQGTILSAFTVTTDSKEIIRISLTDKEIKFSEFPYLLMLEQFKTERLLIDYLEQKGHRIEWETELMDLVQTEDNVEAILRHGDGTPGTVLVKYVVGADGAKSRVRELLQIPFEGKTHGAELSIMECDADVVLPPGEALFSFTRQAATGFFPLSSGKWRIDAALRKMKVRNQSLTFEAVQKQFNRKARIPANIRNPSWFSVFRSHGRYAGQFRNNRCFLAGDAAHVFTPVGGQGMNTGLQDSCNLAWKLAMVIKKRVVPQILETYEEERRPVAAKTCRTSDNLFMVTASGKLPVTILRNILFTPALKFTRYLMKYRKIRDYIFEQVSGAGISYKFNLLNREVSENFILSAPKPGQRLPFVPYEVNGKEVSLYKKIRSDRFLLLVFGDRTHVEAITNTVKGFRDVLITEIIPFSRETSVLYLQFGIKSEGWYLIRPDMHIACRSDEFGDMELKSYLHTLFISNGKGYRR